MDLQSVLTKRSNDVVTSTKASRASVAAGFEDVLTSAFSKSAETDTFSAIGAIIDDRGSRRQAETGDSSSQDRTKTSRHELKDDSRDHKVADTHDNSTKEHKDVNDTKDDVNGSADDASKASSEDQTAKTGTEKTTTQSDTSTTDQSADTTADASSAQGENIPSENVDPTIPNIADMSNVAATGEAELTPAEIKLAEASPTGNTQTAQPTGAQPDKAATQQGNQAQNAQQAQGQQQSQAASQQATTGTAQAASQTQDNVDPLAKQQADGIAQRLDKNENVAISVTKTTQPQQTAQNQNTQQQGQQPQSSDKATSQAQNPLQSVTGQSKSSSDSNGNSDTNGQSRQNFADGQDLKQTLSGTSTNTAAASNKAGPTLFQQSMAAQGNQPSLATQTNQAQQAAQVEATSTSGTTQIASAAGTESSSTTSSSSSQPQVAPLSATQGTEKAQTAQSARAALPKTSIPPKQVADQVKVNISKAVASGNDSINIRLRPGDLGRVEVKLDINKDGSVKAMVMADKPETLEVLRRDSAGLDKALQDAGLKTSQESLNFSLRDQGGQGGSTNNENRNSNPYGSLTADADELDALEENLAAYANTGSSDGVDIQV